MSKKSRKRRRTSKPNLPEQTLRQIHGQQAAAEPKPTHKKVGPQGKAGHSSTREVNLAEEYHYVAEDLTRIATLAGALLLALVVLSFFI